MIQSHHQNNLDESKLSHLERKQLELQLLRAFDNDFDEKEDINKKQSLLPQGLSKRYLTKKPLMKQNLRLNNLSFSSKKTQSNQNSTTNSRKLLLLKAIQSPSKLKSVHKDRLSFNQQHTNRSNASKTSLTSMKSFHHNKRKRHMTEFYEQKQTEKLVNRLLNIKPSKQVTKQSQISSYKKHVMVKNIMMHRVSDQPIKKNSQAINKKPQENSINLKQHDLQKFLKQQKKKTRQQSMLQKSFSLNKKPLSSINYKKRRLNTLNSQHPIKKPQLYSKSSPMMEVEPLKLPKFKVIPRVQSASIEKNFTFIKKYKTPLQSRNKNYF